MAAEQETGYFRGEGGVVWPMTLPLPEVMADKVTRGYLRRVNEDGTPYLEPTPDGDPDGGEQGGSDLTNGVPPRPAKSALKPEWVGYAVLVHGMTPDDAEALTRQDLIDRFGQG